MKYSFIIPVYNTSKYLKKCLNSVINQTYSNYEIIIVNDGSTDNSMDIISKYKNDKIKVIDQKNEGLSMARNNAIEEVSGDYIIFLDSDDYIEKDLLKNINKNIDDVDVLRYQVIVEEDASKVYEEKGFNKVDGKKAFKYISTYHFVEPVWCYAIKKDFYIKNKFSFKKNAYHEDFGLIPYVLYKAKRVKSISYPGYHYIIRNESIMNNKDYAKTYKKVYDMLDQYKNLRKLIKDDIYILSYISNCVIVKAKELNNNDKKEYVSELKKLKVYDYVLTNTFKRRIKKILMKINLNLYLRVVK